MTTVNDVTSSLLSFTEKIQLLNEQAAREKAARWNFDFHGGVPMQTNEKCLHWRVLSR